MKKKLIAIDLDGTTLDTRTSIHPLNIRVVDYLVSLGHYVVIATGRPWRSTKEFYETLKLTTPVCNYNGSYIHHPTDKRFEVDAVSIPLNMILDLENNLSDYLTNIMCELEDQVYLKHDEKTLEGFFWRDKADVFIGDMKDVLKTNPTTIIIETKSSDYNQIVLDYVNKNYPDYICRFWSNSFVTFAEIFPKDINKGNAILKVAKKLNISQEDIIAIGDAPNDIELLKIANIGIAMANASEDLKEVADQITEKSCVDAGLAYHFVKIFDSDKSILND